MDSMSTEDKLLPSKRAPRQSTISTLQASNEMLEIGQDKELHRDSAIAVKNMMGSSTMNGAVTTTEKTLTAAPELELLLGSLITKKRARRKENRAQRRSTISAIRSMESLSMDERPPKESSSIHKKTKSRRKPGHTKKIARTRRNHKVCKTRLCKETRKRLKLERQEKEKGQKERVMENECWEGGEQFEERTGAMQLD